MLSNLLANAIEYSREGGKVLLTTGKTGEQLIISVKDEGIGIAEKDRERIFDRFSQLDTGRSKQHKGQGLGLSITKALADMLDGKVLFSSVPGKGCVFTLTLHEVDDEKVTDLSDDSNEYIFDGAKKF